MARRSRVMLGLFGAAGVAGLGSLPPWVSVDPAGDALLSGELSRTGAQVAPVIPALALVVAAAGLTIALVGPLARRMVSAVAALAGAGIVAAAVSVWLTPEGAARAALLEVTGTDDLTGAEVGVLPWPAVAVVGGALAVFAAAWSLRGDPSWRGLGSRFDRDARAGTSDQPLAEPDAADHWDALSRGDDPTAPHRATTSPEGEHLTE